MKQLVIRLVVPCLLGLFCQPLCAQLPFWEGFESGDFIEGAWNLSGNIQTSFHDPAGGIYCAEAQGSFGLNRVFTPASDTLLTLEFKMKIGQTNTTALIFRIKDGTQATAATGLGLIVRNTGDLIGLDGIAQTSILAYEPNRWYHIRIPIHMRTRTYDVYADSILLAKSFRFYSANFTRPVLFSWSSLEVVSTLFMDDIRWYAGSSTTGAGAPAPGEISWKVFPNPARRSLRIETPDIQDLEYCLIDWTGRECYRGQLQGAGQIDLPELPAGMYQVVLLRRGIRIGAQKLMLE